DAARGERRAQRKAGARERGLRRLEARTEFRRDLLDTPVLEVFPFEYVSITPRQRIERAPEDVRRNGGLRPLGRSRVGARHALRELAGALARVVALLALGIPPLGFAQIRELVAADLREPGEQGSLTPVLLQCAQRPAQRALRGLFRKVGSTGSSRQRKPV